jgi:hypothetical protein
MCIETFTSTSLSLRYGEILAEKAHLLEDLSIILRDSYTKSISV